MPVDEGDDERWAELPGCGPTEEDAGSSSDDDDKDEDEDGSTEAAIIDNIKSLSADDGAAGFLAYKLPRSDLSLTIAHDSTQGLAARVWPSAAMLVEFIAGEVEKEDKKTEKVENGSSFSWRNASVLELGSGPGLTGIAVAALAGAAVLLTDLEGPALTLSRRNVEHNAAEIGRKGGSVDVAPLPWGERGAAQRAWEAASSSSTSSPPSVVIAADVIYDGALFGPLLETLEELAFGGSGSGRSDDANNENGVASSSASSPSPPSSFRPPPRILIAHVRRWKRDARFWAAARKRFEVVDVTPGRRRSEKANDEGEGEEGEKGEEREKRKNQKRYSSHEKGALRVFELFPKIGKIVSK